MFDNANRGGLMLQKKQQMKQQMKQKNEQEDLPAIR